MARSDLNRFATQGDDVNANRRNRARGVVRLDAATTLRVQKIEEDINANNLKMASEEEMSEIITVMIESFAQRKYGV